jgi:spore germination protein PE
MLQRTSSVDILNVKIAAFASTIQLGDSCVINGFSRALAVQREAEIFYGNEGNYSSYSVFSDPISLPTINEDLTTMSHHLNPIIKVKRIGIIGISSASILHVGNSKDISMEVRVKHIRQLLPHEGEQTT